MDTCRTCKHWKDKVCKKLSNVDLGEREDSIPKFRTEVGVIAWPICIHDGPAIEYETEPWFGCIHHEV